MNRYALLLADTEAEIDAFVSGPHGAQCDASWYSDIKDLVRKVAAAPSDPEAERYLDMLCWCIVDSGPLGKGFAPSIDTAADAMQRKRKQEFKERRIRRNEN